MGSASCRSNSSDDRTISYDETSKSEFKEWGFIDPDLGTLAQCFQSTSHRHSTCKIDLTRMCAHFCLDKCEAMRKVIGLLARFAGEMLNIRQATYMIWYIMTLDDIGLKFTCIYSTINKSHLALLVYHAYKKAGSEYLNKENAVDIVTDLYGVDLESTEAAQR
jgi:hypothetical protein